MRLFETNKNSYSGIINSGSSPNNVLIRRQRQWVFMRSRRETVMSVEVGISVGAEKLT